MNFCRSLLECDIDKIKQKIQLPYCPQHLRFYLISMLNSVSYLVSQTIVVGVGLITNFETCWIKVLDYTVKFSSLPVAFAGDTLDLDLSGERCQFTNH